jgi:CDP-glucose 4,6-dehydratase
VAQLGGAVSDDGFWRGKSVLVTGAGGFVGSWLAHALVEHGATVTAILRDEPRLSNFDLLGLGERVNVVRGSVTDAATVERAFNEYEVDTCFHLAAQAIVGVANRSPVSTLESNIRGTWTVLEACRTARLVERVVVASSDKAYGSQPQLPYTEEMPLLGVNPYDASKVCAEVLIRSYRATFGLPVVVARCANIYGGGDLNFSRLVPGTIRSVLAGERPIVRSDGTPVRDYIHVDDAVAAYLALGEQLDGPGVPGEAFNFGGGEPISVRDILGRVLDACDVGDVQPDVRGSGAPAGEIDRQYLDSARAASVLGWQPRVSLGDGLRRTVSWYLAFLAPAATSGASAPVPSRIPGRA